MATAGFGLFLLVMLAMVFVPLAFWIYSLVEVTRAPDAAFGPPWDNGKNAWLLGLVVSIIVPAGTLVTTILWWLQGHKALRARQPVPKPFWAPKPSYPPPYYPVPPPGQGGPSPYAAPGYPPAAAPYPGPPPQQPDSPGGPPR